MPQIIKNDDGEDIEVFSKEELEAASKKAQDDAAAATAKVTEATTALEEAKKELEATKKQLEDTDDKDKNITALRNLVNKQEKTIKAMEETVTKGITEVKETVISGSKSTIFKQITSGDKELQDKMELNWKLIQKDATTEDEIKEKALLAYKMSVDVPNPRVLAGIVSAVPQGGAGSGVKVDEELAAIGPKFGLSKEDIAKFSPKGA